MTLFGDTGVEPEISPIPPLIGVSGVVPEPLLIVELVIRKFALAEPLKLPFACTSINAVPAFRLFL